MVKTNKDQNEDLINVDSDKLFHNLIWLTIEETAHYLRRSTNAVRILLSRGVLKRRKFAGKLYFKKHELDRLIETSLIRGGS